MNCTNERMMSDYRTATQIEQAVKVAYERQKVAYDEMMAPFMEAIEQAGRTLAKLENVKGERDE